MVLAEPRRNEVRVRLDVFDEPGLELRKLEVIVLLSCLCDLAVDFRPGSVRVPIFVGEELFLSGGVPVGLLSFIDQTLIEELLEELLHDLLVTRFGRADIIIVRDIQVTEHAFEDRGNLIDEYLRLHATLQRSLLDLLAVLV